MQMRLLKLLLNPKLKQASSPPFLPLFHPLLFLSFFLCAILLSLHLPPLYSAMLPLVFPPFLLDLWQLTEETCPPLPSEATDPHWEMEMSHHCLSARCASWISSPSISVCIYECRHQESWHNKLTCAVPKAGAWQTDRHREILEGICGVAHTVTSLVTVNYGNSSTRPPCEMTQEPNLPLYSHMTWHGRRMPFAFIWAKTLNT